MKNLTDMDLLAARAAITELMFDDEHGEIARLNMEHRDMCIRLDMVEEIEHELVATLGKRAKHDQELRNVLDIVDLTGKLLRSDLAATNAAIGKIIKGVIDRTLDVQPTQSS